MYCLIYTNYDLFKKIKVTDSGNLVEQTHDLLNSNDTFEMIHEKIYKMLRAGKSEQKAEFALDVIFEISPDELSVPPYINQSRWKLPLSLKQSHFQHKSSLIFSENIS